VTVAEDWQVRLGPGDRILPVTVEEPISSSTSGYRPTPLKRGAVGIIPRASGLQVHAHPGQPLSIYMQYPRHRGQRGSLSHGVAGGAVEAVGNQ